tara:strand:+ start:1412 stop:1522 length:111 start_codon:yes stop_codon:yes gene_type:complete
MINAQNGWGAGVVKIVLLKDSGVKSQDLSVQNYIFI